VVAKKADGKAVKEKKAAAHGKASDAEKKTGHSQSSHAAVAIDVRSGRDRRANTDRRKKQEAVAVERRQTERRVKVNRRRQIDPTTCERDYSLDEIEFMNAVDEYKRTSGRMFPTCSEILEVIRNLGYEKRTGTAAAASVEPLVPGVVCEAAPQTASA
jgi:hypothetical protein